MKNTTKILMFEQFFDFENIKYDVYNAYYLSQYWYRE